MRGRDQLLSGTVEMMVLGKSPALPDAGGANSGGPYVVTDPRTSRTRSVAVSATGRVSVQ